MLLLDGVPQFTVLLLTMAFSVYVAQFIHRLVDNYSLRALHAAFYRYQ